MEEALLDFPGAMVIVSHDRYLLGKICGAVWSITDQTIKVYPGPYNEYMAYKESFAKKELESAEERMRLEYRMAFLTSELTKLDRSQNQPEYQNLETEYLSIAHKLRSFH